MVIYNTCITNRHPANDKGTTNILVYTYFGAEGAEKIENNTFGAEGAEKFKF